MTEQKKNILDSVNYIKARNPLKGKTETAIITYSNPVFLKEFKIIKKLKYKDIPPEFGANGNIGELIFASSGKKNLFILNGHLNYFSGYNMRQSAFPVYVLKELGIKTVIIIDECGYLNPRFESGGVAMIYDHINLMGDNPLIGENDNTLGLRFPDMSNPYDEKLFNKTEKIFIDKKIKFFPSVYLGITGPETETEAECRFYRETGADILGYSVVPENIAAVHAGIKCLAFGMLSRELVADRLEEISPGEKLKNRLKAEKVFGAVIKDIILLSS